MYLNENTHCQMEEHIDSAQPKDALSVVVTEDVDSVSEEKSQREPDTPSTEKNMQGAFKERYLRAVKSCKLREVRETIDIRGTPVFFRRDSGLLAYLEYERLGKIKASGKTRRMINAEGESCLRDKSIFLEAPIPYCHHSFGDEKELERIVSLIAENIHESAPETDLESLKEVIRRSSKMVLPKNSNTHGNGKDMKVAYEQKTERQEFLKQMLKNPEYRKIWLAAQNILLKNISSGEELRDMGLAKAVVQGGNTFLVSPADLDIFTVHDNQTHRDYNFEILAMEGIPENQILGFVINEKYQNLNSMKLVDSISEEAKTLYAHGSADKSGIYYRRKHLNEMVDEVESGHSNKFGIKRKMSDVDFAKTKKDLCAILDINEDSFFAQEAREKIETGQGVYSRYGKVIYGSPERKGWETGRVQAFLQIPTENLTLKEIELEIFKRILPKLRELFPFQKFTFETVERDLEAALTKYIIDKFGVDPDKIGENDFILLVVKKMGIPIYDLRGNQLWPVQKIYADICRADRSK